MAVRQFLKKLLEKIHSDTDTGSETKCLNRVIKSEKREKAAQWLPFITVA
jgi:hypothetical protein